MSQAQNNQRKENLRSKLNIASTKLAIIATPVVLSASAMAAEESNAISLGDLGLIGLTSSAATIFAVKAGPSLMMWGYRKILGFIGR